MAQPTPYDRLYNFTDWQTVNPTKPLPGSELDAELNAIELTTDQIRANLALIQRDDGKLANQSVTPESLSAGTLAMISQGEYLPRGAWAGTTVYAVGDVVEYNLATYLCLIAHTATPAFADDLAAGRWLLIANGALSGGAAAVDLFEGNGSQTVFTLSVSYQANTGANVFVNGVAQIPAQDFTITGDTVTFVVAPPAPAVPGNKNIMVRGTAIEVQLASSAATQAALDAQGYASSASASASTATSQAGIATTQAGIATTQAGISTTQAGIATTKASEASASAADADADRVAAQSAATTATSQANSASASAATATTQAGIATTAANTATTQAGIATSASSSASSSATAASNSASSASASASAASASANSAATSAADAAASAASVNASNLVNNFADQTIGGTKTFSSTIVGSISGNAATATSATTATTATTAGNVTGTVAVANGGTGAADAATARTNLGAAAASHTHAASDITSGTVATARLGSGTANSTTFLRGDNTWQTISTTPTTAQVLTAIAGSTLRAVGTYTTVSQNRTPGTTYTGTALGIGAGTYRCMGVTVDDNNSSSGSGLPAAYASLHLRIS